MVGEQDRGTVAAQGKLTQGGERFGPRVCSQHSVVPHVAAAQVTGDGAGDGCVVVDDHQHRLAHAAGAPPLLSPSAGSALRMPKRARSTPMQRSST